ncbi:hypothetical protein GCM10009613_50510 [Pseudonocardia kongjuensis]|uniref:Uncharacterized protein n=1 Tax=Pseudonocardia kongjuensis TaxID=102227 RepID=A0ABP4IWS7_9PSEU
MCWQAAAAARWEGAPSGTRTADAGTAPTAEEPAPAEELLADAAPDHDALFAGVGSRR